MSKTHDNQTLLVFSLCLKTVKLLLRGVRGTKAVLSINNKCPIIREARSEEVLKENWKCELLERMEWNETRKNVVGRFYSVRLLKALVRLTHK